MEEQPTPKQIVKGLSMIFGLMMIIFFAFLLLTKQLTVSSLPLLITIISGFIILFVFVGWLKIRAVEKGKSPVLVWGKWLLLVVGVGNIIFGISVMKFSDAIDYLRIGMGVLLLAISIVLILKERKNS